MNRKLPRAIVINKLDRERASFERTMESIHARFGRAAVPIQLPLGSEKDFSGVIDLVRMKAYVYTFPMAMASRKRRRSRQITPKPQRKPTKNWSNWSPKAKTT